METPSAPKKNKVMPIILALIVIGSTAFGITKYIYAQHHEDTDDAQVDGDISPVLSRTAGYVNSIRFEDNQEVKKGDTLVIIDDRDLRLKVEQAQAAMLNASASISAAEAAVSTSESSVGVANSNIEAAKVRVWKATQDYNRYDALLKSHSATQQQFDAAKADKQTAEAALATAQEQLQVARRQSEASRQQVSVNNAQLAQRQADLDFAKLQLSYTVITAPASGRASRKNVQPGQLVNAGSPICAIVSSDDVYVIANFKETQLEKMREGQSVEVTADAFPGTPINGKVYRFSAATGAKFSLLPPDNATGNFVKVVQRVPVKVKLDGDKQLLAQLRPGMSVRVSVKTN